MRTIAALLALMLSPAMGSSLTVSVDRSGETRHELVLLADLVKETYDTQKRWIDIHLVDNGVEAVVGDVEKDKDFIAAVHTLQAEVPGITVSTVSAHAFWFHRAVPDGVAANRAQKQFSRIEDTIMDLRPPLPGVTIEAAGDTAVVRCSAPGFAEILRDKTRHIMTIEPVSAGVWHAAWNGDVTKRLKSYAVDKMLAFLLREPLDLVVEPMRDGAMFVADDTPRYAAFLATVRGAFAADVSYTLRETTAARVLVKVDDKANEIQLPLNEILDLLRRILENSANPSIHANVVDDHVRVRAVTLKRVAERMAVVRKLLEGRGDLIITERKDHGLDIRLKPGAHLLTTKPPVDDARLAESIRVRAAALKLGPVMIASAGPERAVVSFATDADAAAFRQSISFGPRLTIRLVDEGGDFLDPKPGPGVECLKASYGPPICLKLGVILTGEMVADAEDVTDDQTGQVAVAIRLTEDGRKLFAATTRAHVSERLAIVVDGVVMTAPMIREPIEGGRVQITGNFTIESAKALAARIVPDQSDLPLRIERP